MWNDEFCFVSGVKLARLIILEHLPMFITVDRYSRPREQILGSYK